jgi:hypothetical protein
MGVSWGPNADANNVKDSILLNYPPSGVQTLGFLALQMQGDTTASDTQSPSAAWSSRVQAIPVTISGTQTLPTLYPDSYGCVFAQLEPGTYTVSVGQPTNGYPAGTSYGSPPFVANAAGIVTNHVWGPTQSEPQPLGTPNPTTLPTVSVSIGAVTKVQSALNGDYPGFDQASTVNLAYPSSTATEDGVSCPGAAQITCIAAGQNAADGRPRHPHRIAGLRRLGGLHRGRVRFVGCRDPRRGPRVAIDVVGRHRAVRPGHGGRIPQPGRLSDQHHVRGHRHLEHRSRRRPVRHHQQWG